MLQYQSIILNLTDQQQVDQLGTHINTCVLDQYLAPWEKLRHIMFHGARIASIYLQALENLGVMNGTDEETEDALDRFNNLLDVPIQAILNSEHNFAAFASGCYVANQMILLDLALHYGGARLNYNSFFVNLYNLNLAFFNDNNSNTYAAYNSHVLYKLVFDIVDRQPWFQRQSLMPQPVPAANEQSAVNVEQVITNMQQLEIALEQTNKPANNEQVNNERQVTQDTDDQQVTQQQDTEQPTVEKTAKEVTPRAISPDAQQTSPSQQTEPYLTNTPPPLTIEQQIYQALAIQDVRVCNNFYESEQTKIQFLETLCVYINKNSNDAKLPQFLKDLHLNIDEHIEIIKSRIVNPNNTIVLFNQLLSFSDREIYRAHLTFDLYNILGTYGNFTSKLAKAFKDKYRPELKNKIKSCELQFAVQPDPIATNSKPEAINQTKLSKAPVKNRNSSNETKQNANKSEKAKTDKNSDADLAYLDSIIAQNPAPQVVTISDSMAAIAAKVDSSKPAVPTALEEKVDAEHMLNLATLTKAIYEHNTAAVNQMLDTDEINDFRHVIQALFSVFGDRNLHISKNFLLNLNLSEDLLNALVKSKLCTKFVTFTLMQKILALPDEEFYYYNTDSEFESILDHYTANTTNDDDTLQLYLQLELKCKQSLVAAKLEATKVFTLLNAAQPGSELEITHYKYVANTAFNNSVTVLMLALQKQIGVLTLVGLINNSCISILKINDSGENIFHYWAKYLNFNTLQIVDKLWLEYKTRWQQVGLEVNYLSSQSLDTGNTFLHELANHPDDALAAIAIVRLFEISNDLRFHVPLLIKNHEGKTPLDIIVERDVFNLEMQRFILTKISEVALVIYVESEDFAQTVFPKDNKFFAEHNTRYIQKLLAAGRFKDILQKVYINTEGRCQILARPIIGGLAGLTPSKIHRAKSFKLEMERYFGSPEFLDKFDGEYLLSLVVHQICNTNDKDLEIELDCDLIKHTEQQIPINESLAWRRIKQHLAQPTKNLLSKDLYKKYVARLKPRTNAFQDSRVALDYAILEADPLMVEFLVNVCGAKIDDRILCNAVTQCFINDHTSGIINPDALIVTDYIFNNSRAKNRKDVRTLLGVGLYSRSSYLSQCPEMIKWLIKHNYPFDTIQADGKCLFHKLIEMWDDNKAGKYFEVLMAFFTDPVQATSLINHKNEIGYTCIYYLFEAAFRKKISAASLYALLEIFIQHGAVISDCGIKDGKTALHYALALKDCEILNLMLRSCKTDHLLSMFNSIDQKTNTTIMQSASIAAAKDQNLQKFADTLKNSVVTITSANKSTSLLKMVAS